MEWLRDGHCQAVHGIEDIQEPSWPRTEAHEGNGATKTVVAESELPKGRVLRCWPSQIPMPVQDACRRDIWMGRPGWRPTTVRAVGGGMR